MPKKQIPKCKDGFCGADDCKTCHPYQHEADLDEDEDEETDEEDD